jgi:hypothetical protein
LDNDYFVEEIGRDPNILWAAPTPLIKDKLKEYFDIDAEEVAAGVNLNHFKPTREITKITTLGMSGKPGLVSGWDAVKRPDLLKAIAKDANVNYHFIHSQDHTLHDKLYDPIDMYVCCSTSEAGPYGIVEAAACKIPVISTPVGYASKLKSIKTFNTLTEAVEIIKELNSDPEKLKKYIEDVYEEVTREYDWNHVAYKYWKPLIEKRIELNG